VDGSAFLLLFLVFAAAVVVLAYVGYQRRLERIRDMRSLALAHGLDFAIEDPFGTLGEPFSLLQAGDGRGVENVLWGTWEGLEIRAFDYWYYEESTDSEGHTSRSYHRFDCALAPIEAACPPLRIGEENLLTRLAGALSFDDIRFESEEFNRRFQVKGPDAHFATALCDARMMDWLLANGDGHAFELTGARLLCSRRLVEPAELLDLFAIAKAFRERIPPVVSSLYPKR
jgi:hypothetical protein